MELGTMNGAKVSRRSVYENEQKFSESQLGAAVNEAGKNKTENSTTCYAVDVNVFPPTESGRDLKKKAQLSTEDRPAQAEYQPTQHSQSEIYHPNFLTIHPSTHSNPLCTDYRPKNFGIVAPGIYRSSFPVTEDFQYLKSLQLKTILSLVRKDFDPEFRDFVTSNSINHIVLDMIGTKKVEISEPMINNIMSIALDQSRYPILIHCNRGRHRTGCAIAAIRYVKGWDMKNTLQEYRDFATPKARECDINYITNLQMSTLGHVIKPPSKVESKMLLVNKLIYPRTWRMILLSTILIVIFMTLRCFWEIDLRSKYEG